MRVGPLTAAKLAKTLEEIDEKLTMIINDIEELKEEKKEREKKETAKKTTKKNAA